nr:MAG TPA: hypothetical protein [Caudoviricetes sp.]
MICNGSVTLFPYAPVCTGRHRLQQLLKSKGFMQSVHTSVY